MVLQNQLLAVLGSKTKYFAPSAHASNLKIAWVRSSFVQALLLGLFLNDDGSILLEDDVTVEGKDKVHVVHGVAAARMGALRRGGWHFRERYPCTLSDVPVLGLFSAAPSEPEVKART